MSRRTLLCFLEVLNFVKSSSLRIFLLNLRNVRHFITFCKEKTQLFFFLEQNSKFFLIFVSTFIYIALPSTFALFQNVLGLSCLSQLKLHSQLHILSYHANHSKKVAIFSWCTSIYEFPLVDQQAAQRQQQLLCVIIMLNLDII